MLDLLKSIIIPDPLRDLKIYMRIRNTLINKSKSFNRKIYNIAYCRLQVRYNSEIPLTAVIPDNTVFPHGLNGILISKGAKIGHGCTIFQQVTIGSNTLKGSKNIGSPIIGNNVYIGAGAKIIGGITIGNNVRIGANAVVVNDIPDNSTVVSEKSKIIFYDYPRDNTFCTFQITD